VRACVTPADWKRRSRQPKNTFYYGAGELFDVAAAYAFHIAQAQACLDGNKRTGAAVMIEFLAINGWRLEMRDDETLGRWFEAVIEGRMSEAELADAMWPFVRGIS